MPTPMPTPLPLATMPGCAAVPLTRPGPAEAAAATVPPRQPGPRSLLTSSKGSAEAASAAMPQGQQAALPGAEVRCAAPARPHPGSSDSSGALDVAADLLALAASPPPPTAPPAQHRALGVHQQAAAQADCAELLRCEPALVAESHQPAPAVEQQALVQAQPAAAALPAAAAHGAAIPVQAAPQGAAAVAAPAPAVPSPVLHAFAAAGQLVYHQPRPSSCPPLFKHQRTGQPAAAAAVDAAR
jgi:hypothetical protein